MGGMPSGLLQRQPCNAGNVDTLWALLHSPEGWLDEHGWFAYKEHRLTVSGTGGAIVFDDTRPWAESCFIATPSA